MARPRNWTDDILEVWDAGVDESLIEERLKLTPEQRLERMLDFMGLFENVHASSITLNS